ncbi:Elongation factor P, C-terminal [Phytophthora cactorum]|nr:Elongation factor P, C-terminal [Phytophthora cactorum]
MMLRRAITQIARATAPARGYGVRFATINGACRHGSEIDGKIYRVGKNQHVKPGKGGAYVQVLLISAFGRAQGDQDWIQDERRFRAAESVNKAPLGPDESFQFLYYNGGHLVIMHNGTFEQMEIERDLFSGRQLDSSRKGDVLWANMPEYVTLEVTGVADTALSVKDATLENGAVVKVPLFIEIGNKVKVSTEDGAYVDKL